MKKEPGPKFPMTVKVALMTLTEICDDGEIKAEVSVAATKGHVAMTISKMAMKLLEFEMGFAKHLRRANPHVTC